MARNRKWIFIAIFCVIQVIILEVVARRTCRVAPKPENYRQLLRGEVDLGPAAQYSIGQAYLLYIPAPNFHDESGLEHNAHGYRGRILPQARTPGVARI